MTDTIPAKIFSVAAKQPQAVALEDKIGDTYLGLTYADLVERVESCAAGLLDLGIKPGERVALLSNNRSEWAIADLGIMKAGAVTVGLHTTFSPHLLKFVINHSGAKAIVVAKQEQLNKLLLILNEVPDLKTIIFIDPDHNDLEDWEGKHFVNWDDFLAQKKEGSEELPDIQTNPDDVATIVYTSGTTGEPKGVSLTHKNILSNVDAATKAVPIHSTDSFLSFLPLSHVLERTTGYYVPLIKGAKISYAESVKTLADNLKEVKPTILISVPRIFERIHDGLWEKLKAGSPLKRKIFVWALRQQPGTFGYKVGDALVFKKVRAKFGGRFRLTISGGASLNAKLAKFFEKLGIQIYEGYGLTETAPVLTANREGARKFGTVGQALDGVEVKLAEDKEIIARGDNVMPGYHDDQASTNAMIDSEGWLHTGDQGHIDEDGFLTIVGRKKELIVTSTGKNVWPASLEVELNDDRYINQSLIIGHDRKYLVALLVPDWQEVKRYCKEKKLAYYDPEELAKRPEIIELFKDRVDTIGRRRPEHERVVSFTLLVDEFTSERDELTPTLKPRREIIKNNYAKEIEGMYS